MKLQDMVEEGKMSSGAEPQNLQNIDQFMP